MWSGVWGRDESVFGDWSISLSHVLVDLKRLLFDSNLLAASGSVLWSMIMTYLMALLVTVHVVLRVTNLPG